jgi:hypothetical protein
VLDELGFLATVEHALVVECLSVRCALGHDTDAAEGGATTEKGHDAADAANLLSVSEMRHLKAVNLGLIDAVRLAQLGRAASISSNPVADTSLDLPGLAQLQEVAAREHVIASAVGERYARLRPAVTSGPGLDGDLVGDVAALGDVSAYQDDFLPPGRLRGPGPLRYGRPGRD